jgi:AraC-like DNA-binding protein
MLIIVVRNHLLLRLSVFIIDIGISILFILSQKHPNLYRDYITIVKQSNKKKSHLEKLDLEILESQLTDLFEKEKIYHDDELTLGILSEKLNINVHQLSEFLNNHMNHNFSSFLSSYRIEEAKIFLSKESDASIISIAYKVGFNSISSFNRAFKKFTGVSPNQFRNSSLMS